MIAKLRRMLRAPAPAPAPPLLSDRVLVFAGNFASELTATDYALGLSKTTLARDLGDVNFAPDDVEIIHGIARITAARPMFRFTAPVPATDANTYIMVSDRGYDASRLKRAQVTFLGMAEII